MGNGFARTAPGTPWLHRDCNASSCLRYFSRVVGAYGNAGTTTDQAVALALHKSATSWAFTDVDVMNDDNNPAYFGSLVSRYSMGRWKISQG